MKIRKLQALQQILGINWLLVPMLGILVWRGSSPARAFLFFIAWVIADKIWDMVTGVLILAVGRIGGSEQESFEMEFSEEVPGRMAFMMIVDLLGTLLAPWVAAAFFLVWRP